VGYIAIENGIIECFAGKVSPFLFFFLRGLMRFSRTVLLDEVLGVPKWLLSFRFPISRVHGCYP